MVLLRTLNSSTKFIKTSEVFDHGSFRPPFGHDKFQVVLSKKKEKKKREKNTHTELSELSLKVLLTLALFGS